MHFLHIAFFINFFIFQYFINMFCSNRAIYIKNFHLADRTLVCDFKNAWIVAEKYHDEAQRARETSYDFAKSERWLCFLAEVRTFFEENPQVDF